MADRHIIFSDYKGDPNLGFYGHLSDSIAVVAPGYKQCETFDVDTVIETSINQTDLVGLFVTGNDNGLLVPPHLPDHILAKFDEHEIAYQAIDTTHNALGNLVLVNDNGCLLSPHLEDEKDTIASVLDVDVEIGTVADLAIVGSAGIATNDGVLLHREASEDELATAEEVLDVDGDIGTVNFGSPYVGTGIVSNSTTCHVGNDTKGPETGRIEQALGFID